MAEGGSVSKTPKKNNDDSSSDECSQPKCLPESTLPWARIYAVAEGCQDMEFAWTVKEYTTTSKKHEDECITNACGIVRPGQIAAIVSAMGSAADSMALILSGKIRNFVGSVSCEPSSISFIEDIEDFTYVLPSHLTVFEAVDFYLGLCIPSAAGSPEDFDSAAKSCIKEFDLLDVQDIECVYLNPTHSKLLYMLSILLNPSPILILHNPERYLEDEHCFTVAKRLTAIAASGHSVLICSSQIPQSLIDVCTYMQVFHRSGVIVYSGSPKGFAAFLLTQRIPMGTHSSTSENIFKIVSLTTSKLKKMEFLNESPPIPPILESHEPIPQGKSSAFILHLLRTIYILVRDPSLLITRGTVSMIFAIYCSTIVRVQPEDRLGDIYAITVLDCILMLLSAIGLVFGYAESKSIDVLLIEESRSIGQFTHPTVILVVRFITILATSLCITVFPALIALLACNTFIVFSVRSCVLLLPSCALLYSFLGAFCALFKNCSMFFLPLMIIVFLWSIMATVTPMFEIRSKASTTWRFVSPLYISKALVCADKHEVVTHEINNAQDVGEFKPLMDFRLQPSSQVMMSFAILVSLLSITIVAYLARLYCMVSRCKKVDVKFCGKKYKSNFG